MFKNLNLRKVIAIAICLAGMTMFSGCDKENDPKSAEKTPVVTGVTVTPVTISIAKGATQDFTATVAGTNLEETDKAVNWTVTGGTKIGTAIATDGTLAVAMDETATSLTVKATSVVDNSKSGVATVTVTEDHNFITFSDGKIPNTWQVTGWMMDNTIGIDDTYSFM